VTTKGAPTEVEGWVYFDCTVLAEVLVKASIRTAVVQLSSIADLANRQGTEAVKSISVDMPRPTSCGGVHVRVTMQSVQFARILIEVIGQKALTIDYMGRATSLFILDGEETSTQSTTATSSATTTGSTTVTSTTTDTSTTRTSSTRTASTTTTQTTSTTTSTDTSKTSTVSSLTSSSTTSSTTTVDNCNIFICGYYCIGSCGWDSDIDKCFNVTTKGDYTSEMEYIRGDCTSLQADDRTYDDDIVVNPDLSNTDSSASGSSGLFDRFDPKIVIIIAIGACIVFLVILTAVYLRKSNRAKRSHDMGPQIVFDQSRGLASHLGYTTNPVKTLPSYGSNGSLSQATRI
jgi:hypothetical protein